MANKQPKIVPVPIKRDTKAAIDMFNEKRSAASMVKDDSPKKLKASGYIKTANDKFFDYIETDGGKHIALLITVAVITAVAYWLIKQ